MRSSLHVRTGRRPAGRHVAVAAALGIAMIGSPAAVGSAAAAARCTPDARDVFAGAPRYQDLRGAVEIRNGSATQVLTRGDLGVGDAVVGDEFGAALALERTGNGCAVLVIGAPGAYGGVGAVYVAVESPAGGFHPAGVQTLVAPAGAAGDRVGEALLISRSATSDAAGAYELWVGAPRRDRGSAADAGALERYRVVLAPDSGSVGVSHGQTLAQGTASVPGTTAEAGDRFGEVLAGAQRGVVVGVPREDVGSAVDAGMVSMIGAPAGASTYRSLRNITQDSAGIAGTAESGDRFGAAVAACARVIGVPGEDVGSIRDAGMAQLLEGCDPLDLQPGRAVHQDSAGVPGASEAGDRFGAAVVERQVFEDGGSAYVGIPGEDLGSAVDAGAFVGEYSGCPDETCPWSAWTQGDRLAGAAESGDAVGTTLSVRHFYGVSEPGVHETSFPLAGAPGEDIGSVVDAGAAYSRATDENGASVEVVRTFSEGPVAGLRFGTVFASDTYGYPSP